MALTHHSPLTTHYMQVIKRNGKSEAVHFDKITSRVMKLSYGLSLKSDDVIEIAKKVIVGIYNNVTTTELDNLAAETAASFTTRHPDFAVLAARIAVSNLHKNTVKSFSEQLHCCTTILIAEPVI